MRKAVSYAVDISQNADAIVEESQWECGMGQECGSIEFFVLNKLLLLVSLSLLLSIARWPLKMSLNYPSGATCTLRCQ